MREIRNRFATQIIRVRILGRNLGLVEVENRPKLNFLIVSDDPNPYYELKN